MSHDVCEIEGKKHLFTRKLNINIILILRALFQSNDEANMFNTFKHFAKDAAISHKSHFKRFLTSVAFSTRLLKSIFDQGPRCANKK